ncbi:hypothetical protein CHLRE_01g013900v5 [Chlamydomonas reinhardtii]|nr:uncharacterized protein CHLRE_01g013900v5 [Chlamydomonas reinhardtii]PNW88095.1 hypothetical protein CHLRE_01g013900v5 [Chlamydomonas reinhardtii]
MPADSREAQAARLALERLNSLAAAREEYKAWVLRQLHLGEELPTAAARGADTSKPDMEPQHDKLSEKELNRQASLTTYRRYQFASFKDFLQEFQPPSWKPSSCGSLQSTEKDVPPPSKVLDWQTFELECQELMDKITESGPAIDVTVLASPSAAVDCEATLQDELLWCFLKPLQVAASAVDNFFVCGRMQRDVVGLPANSGRPDFLILSDDSKTLLVAVEVKTSAALWVPHGSSLPDAYAAANKKSNIVKAVLQLYSYLDRVPYGVLLTDKQLFCMRREHTELLCSPSIPMTHQGEAAGGSGAGSLTAAAAVYCIAKMSQTWWMQRQPQPSGSPGGRGRGCDTAGNRWWRSILQGFTAWLAGSSTIMGAAVAAAAASEPVAPPPAVVTESRCTSSQLFPGYRPDPQVPGHTPRCLGDSSLGVVLQGVLGGLPAAVKLVDLWQQLEGRELLQHEVGIYGELQPLQGSYVPQLLGYGYCDGWQYFLATSLEGPSLNREDGWTLGEAVTRAGAFAALDAVHACGVLHGDIALRNFVLAASHSQPAGMEGGAAAGGGGGGGGVEGGRAWQQEPCVMLLDFGHAKLVATAAEECGEEPAELLRRERKELQQLLGCEPPLPAASGCWGAQAAAAAGSNGSDMDNQQKLTPGLPDLCAAPDSSVVANRPSSLPAVHSSQRQPVRLLPAPPPSRSGGLGGWRMQLQPCVPRKFQLLTHHNGRHASRASIPRLQGLGIGCLRCRRRLAAGGYGGSSEIGAAILK